MKRTTTIKNIYNIFRKYGDLNIKVNTPYGFKKILGCDITERNANVIKIATDNDLYLKCSTNHKIKTKNGKFIKAIDLLPGNSIKTIKGNSKIKSLDFLPLRRDLYDIEVSEVKQYYSNGIVSHNSSVFSALTFCIWDKCDKGYKASNLLNNQKMSFRCKFNFEIDGIDYFIERSGKSDKKGNVPVAVKFWKVESGVETELHSEDRYKTDEVIRDYLGTYEDFILTTFSIQNQTAKNSNSFIDMGQSDRKDLLCQFIGLTVFDRLYNTAYEKSKELTVLLREYKNDDFTKKLVDYTNQVTNFESLYSNTALDLKNVEAEYNKTHQDIIEVSKGFVSDNTSNKVVDITKANSDLNKVKKQIESKKLDHQKIAQQLQPLKDKIDHSQGNISMMENIKIESKYNELVALENRWKDSKNVVDQKRIEMKSKLEKLDRLKKHEYDPNCRFCMNNIFVKDAIKTQEELETDKIESSQLIRDFKRLTSEKDALQSYADDYKLLLDLRKALIRQKDEYNDLNNKIVKLDKEINTLTTHAETYQRDIDFYHNHQKDIESNIATQKKVDALKLVLQNLEQKRKKNNDSLRDTNGKITVLRSQIDEIKQKVEKAKSIEVDYEAYTLYVQCVGRDGIPYEVITSAVPEIENEVNSILSQIVEFTVELESDGKNITPYIVYDKNRWSLELSSGLERFIASLAIRIALVNISNLPRCNALLLDEGFSCADADNLASMNTLFAYLKTVFDFVIIISHLDTLKDAVDTRIEIKRENGFSLLKFE